MVFGKKSEVFLGVILIARWPRKELGSIEDPSCRSAKRPRRDTSENDLASKLFSTLPEWRITEEDIKTIRGKGLVPDKLILNSPAKLVMFYFYFFAGFLFFFIAWTLRSVVSTANLVILVPLRIVDWFLHPLRKYPINAAQLFLYIFACIWSNQSFKHKKSNLSSIARYHKFPRFMLFLQLKWGINISRPSTLGNT